MAVPVPIPVFPLPDVVLLPGCWLPLHVFELRYRALVRDALAGGRSLAIATLEPGWELDDPGSPAFHPLGCLASLEEVEWLPDGCYDLKLMGTERVRFGRHAREFPYRACEVEILPVTPYDEDDPLTRMERSALEELAKGSHPPAVGFVAELALKPYPGFEIMINRLASAMLEVPDKLELLAMDSVLDRSRRLREHLERRKAPPPPAGEESGLN